MTYKGKDSGQELRIQFYVSSLWSSISLIVANIKLNHIENATFKSEKHANIGNFIWFSRLWGFQATFK